MYLKRLELQGFKSFASKTALEFGTGVTSIVGPNGCGKTNVADALRWVLGEHASRMLRARKTEDVIFAGSDRRAPMGMAEVSITLDNSGQWLPVEFSEVVVARRAYRDGENEYIINGSRVRLRDVIDLFLRAQVGQNSYAFMGQGMVEQVLSLRPEDRRALIEEAADVRLYRNRLEEAQTKLKATRENLERVQLLVREIQPRITQLERQAGRAVRYQELTRDLAATLHVWYSHHWQEVNEHLLAAITTHDQRAEEFERLKAEAKACEDGLAQLRAAIIERRGEIELREGRLRNLQDYARDLDRRVALDAERGKFLAERLAEIEAELASLRDDLAAQERSAVVADTAEQETALAAARALREEQRVQLAAVEQELVRLQRSSIEHEQVALRSRALADDLSRKLAETVDAIARLRREDVAATEDRRKLIAEIAAWARSCARTYVEARELGSQLDAAVAERNDLAEVLDTYRRERAALDDEVHRLRAHAEAAQARLDVLRTIDVQPQSPDAGVRLILEAGGVLKRETVPPDVELAGVVGLVGQIVKVPPGLEKAIEAALAESLFGIVIDRRSNMRPVLDALLAGDVGRATLYALDDVQEIRPLNLIKERGVVGVASQLVRCDNRYRRLIDTLLGRTVIVEDLALAQRVVRRGMASAVATRDGILLRPVGAVSAGSLATVRASFTRERELDDLPRELERLRALLPAREGALAESARCLEETQTRHDTLGLVIDTLRERKSRIDMEPVAQKAKLEMFRTRMQSLDGSARRGREQLDRLLREREPVDAGRAAAAQSADEAALAAAAERERIAALESQRASLAEAATEQAAIVAHLEGALRTERQVGASDRVALERLARQIAAKQSQHAKIAEEAQTVAARLASAQRELAERNAEIEALRSEIEPAREELAQLGSRERTLTAELAEVGAKLRSAERALFDAENDARIRRDELESLRQSLEAEGFVATEEGEIRRAPDPEPQRDGAAAGALGQQEGDLPPWLRSDEDSDLPPVRGGSAINPAEVRDHIADLRAQIRALGPVNEQAATDYTESRERYDFLTSQLADLTQAEAQLNEAIAELETVIRDRFRTTFRTVNREFERYFFAFFRGGTARLELGETDEYGLPGIEIVAQPPGKKLGSLVLLSGGERSLTAVALLFALLQTNPSPICVLDEVDAALDEANVGRFVDELRELARRTQFIIITHNRRTIETADTIYGVSMGADNVSRVLSLRLADVSPDLAE